jgi:hypothetical protein
MVHMLDTLISHLTPTFSFLARFSSALLRSHARPALSFLSKVSHMGSLESAVRGWGFTGRRSGDL